MISCNSFTNCQCNQYTYTILKRTNFYSSNWNRIIKFSSPNFSDAHNFFFRLKTQRAQLFSSSEVVSWGRHFIIKSIEYCIYYNSGSAELDPNVVYFYAWYYPCMILFIHYFTLHSDITKSTYAQRHFNPAHRLWKHLLFDSKGISASHHIPIYKIRSCW